MVEVEIVDKMEIVERMERLAEVEKVEKMNRVMNKVDVEKVDKMDRSSGESVGVEVNISLVFSKEIIFHQTHRADISIQYLL